MNFLAHLWLAERAQLPLAGAILGDVMRGALPESMPEPLARSIRLHRRLDAATDRHPHVVLARSRFAPGPRRYAGIVLDLLHDHVLAQDWTRYSAEPLEPFAARAAREIEDAARWFEHAGERAPAADPFAQLLLSYRSPSGLEHAARRTASRFRKPEPMWAAMEGWQGLLPALRAGLPELLEDLARVSIDPGAAAQTKV